MVAASSKEFLSIETFAESGFTLKRVRKMIRYRIKSTIEITTDNTAQSFSQFGYMVKCSFTN